MQRVGLTQALGPKKKIVATFTPDKSFVELANLIEHELARTKPFGVASFTKTFDYSRLMGLSANFTGVGADPNTQLNISYMIPDDLRAVDAVACSIARGDKRIYISHYLSHIGSDSKFMSNLLNKSPEEFAITAISQLGQLDQHQDLMRALAGGDLVDIPFDWGDAR